jgi:hypothetical protein
VFDQFLLGELEALRLAATGLFDREALFASPLGKLEDRLRWQPRVHARTLLGL